MAFETLANETFYGGAAGGGKCLTEDHEVMTELRGWQPIKDVQLGEQVASYGNGRIVWRQVTDVIEQDYSGEMYYYDSPEISFLATPNHRVPVYDIATAQVSLKFVSALRYRDNLIGNFTDIVPYDPRSMNKIQYVGKVYCLTVPEFHTFVVRHDKRIHVTGNSDLLLGWALTRAVKSIIFRREYPQLKQIIDRSHAMLDAGKIAKYNGQQYVWNNIPGGRTLEFGSVPHEDSVTKYMGRPHDFIGFDEVSNFTLLQYIFLSAWNRTEIKGIRTRIISAGNPPTNVEGEWVIRRWAPWLDPQYGNPAAPGELRWFAQLGEKEEEVENGEPIKISRKVTGRDEDELIYPTSRTFIPASVDDNPHYGQDYKARLQSLPIELREKFLYGNFGIVFKDDPWQVIPSAWVKEGRERYNEMKEKDKVRELENVNPAFGVDPAEAGKDNSTIAKITINVVQYIKYNPEADSMKVADWIVATMIGARGATIAIDSIGVGAGVHYRLKQLGFQSLGIKVSSKTSLRDRTGNMQFLNLRAYLWWMLRDALDPNGGIKLAIPPDIKLERELITPRWELTDSGLVQVEKQDSIRQRLGRSPDAANAVMLALFVSKARRPPLRMV
jgi:hypothetical protein